jgi:Domain of unknown function (DUF4360)
VIQDIVAIGAMTSAVLFPAQPTTVQVVSEVPTQIMTVAVATVNGTGCKPGTAAVAVSPDNTAFTVTYSEYIAEAGPSVALTAARRNCQLSVAVNVPGGYTFAVNKTDYRGYANIAAGASAVQQASYYFQGMSSNQIAVHPTLRGPFADNWQFTDEVPLEALVWHPCGAQRNLNINTEIRLTKGTSTAASYINMDATDSAINTIIHYKWDEC